MKAMLVQPPLGSEGHEIWSVNTSVHKFPHICPDLNSPLHSWIQVGRFQRKVEASGHVIQSVGACFWRWLCHIVMNHVGSSMSFPSYPSVMADARVCPLFFFMQKWNPNYLAPLNPLSISPAKSPLGLALRCSGLTSLFPKTNQLLKRTWTSNSNFGSVLNLCSW